MTLAECSLQQAHSQYGVQEFPRGSNAGPGVEKYLRSVGLGKGYAWCMAFVYWCVQQAAQQQGAVNPLTRTAGVLAQWNALPARRVTAPRSGDIFIMEFSGGTGHTGFVDKVNADGTVTTIEGNTDQEASREGYIVTSRIRKVSTMKGFIRI